jgi:transposase
MNSEKAAVSGKQLTRKQRKELARRLWSQDPGLDVVHRDAAGIDIGSREHYVAVGPDRDPQPVRCFGCFTADLHRMAEWLKACGVKTVAMQSTGVYWVPVYDILQQHGLEVWLVNARHTRSLPGRKSDVQESQWLLKLHTYGLLNNSFRPPAEIRALRTYWRQRAEHVGAAGTAIQRMQKALTEMNVQLAQVISDLSGVTGQAILRAIVAGERDGVRLAQLKDPRIQSSQEEIAKSLQGHWLPEQVFVLRQQLELYDYHHKQMAECDQQLQAGLQSLPSQPCRPAESSEAARPDRAGARKRKPKGNQPVFDLQAEQVRIAGVDLTRIDGVDVMTAQTIYSEFGPDMSPWRTEAHFASHLGLCPDNRISGGKVLKRGTRKVVHPVATALRLAATTLIRSKSYLGAQFRRLRTKLGAPKAITAMAHKLARLVYRMLKYGQEYVDKGLAFYEQKYRQQQRQQLAKKAKELGFQLVEIKAVA